LNVVRIKRCSNLGSRHLDGGSEGTYELVFHILVTIHEPPRPF